ncbi:MAG: glycosyltransferase family 2 protein [Fluviibacter sp.]
MNNCFSKFKVSVVIPCFNSEKWVAKAIDSALDQGIPSLEVIVINDGSTDQTRDILNGYGSRIVVHNQSNAGVSRARREGVRKARGQYIKFLDADDILPAGALKQLLSVAECFPGDAVLGRAVAVDVNGQFLDEHMYSLPFRPRDMSILGHEFLLTQPTSSGVWLIGRSVVDDDNFFDESIVFGEEYLFCLALIEKNISVRTCDAIIYHARQHDSPTRLSRSRRETDHLRQAEMIRAAVAVINCKIPRHSPVALPHIARLSWSRGRDCLRIGCDHAAKVYFDLARNIEPSLKPVGSRVYRSICRCTGPDLAERIVSSINRLIGGQVSS